MPETITSLIEKLEGAGVGSRELDCAMFQFDPMRAATGYWFADEKPGANPVAAHVPAVTTSLDAALALAERVVGSKEALLLLNDLLTREADVSDFDLITISDLPRLLCAAVLRAQSEARV